MTQLYTTTIHSRVSTGRIEKLQNSIEERRKALLSLASLLIALTINADDIVIKSPDILPNR